MMLLHLFSFVLIIVFITLFVVFLSKSNNKGVNVSLIGVLVGIGFIIVLGSIENNKAKKYINSWKSKEISRVERQFVYLKGQPASVINKFIKFKLDKFILKSELKDSFSLYSPNKTFEISEVKKIESSILQLSNKYSELNPNNFNQKKTELIKVYLELVSSKTEEIFVLILRGITNDSSTVLIKSIFDPKTNELVIINIGKCYSDEGNGYITDIKKEIVYYCSLQNCSNELRSQSNFIYHIHHIKYYNNQKTNFQNDIFPLIKNATFLIDGKVYTDYRLFDFTNLLKMKPKPSSIVEW